MVGAPRKGSDDAIHVDEHLEELERLADTAGAQVVGQAIQRIDAPTSNFYLGQGKVEELKETLAAAGANAAYSSMTRKLEVASKQKNTSAR